MYSRYGLWMPLALALVWLMPASAQTDSESLYRRGLALEREGKTSEAIRIYFRAMREGSGGAGQRIVEILLQRDAGSIEFRRAPDEFRHAPDGKDPFRRERIEGGWGCPPKC